MKTSNRVRRSGISLLELLFTVAITTALLGVIIPATQSAREASRQLQCKMKLRQLALGLTLYATDHGDSFPRGGPWISQIREYLDCEKDAKLVTNYLGQCPSTPGYPNHRGTYESRDYSYPGRLKVYLAPEDYEFRRGVGTIGRIRKLTDGLSNTFLALEQAGPYGAYIGRPSSHEEGSYPSHVPVDDGKEYLHKSIWSAGGNKFIHHRLGDESPFYSGMQVNKNNKQGIYGFHDGANAAMCDGSVRFLPTNSSPGLNAVLFTGNDGDLPDLVGKTAQ